MSNEHQEANPLRKLLVYKDLRDGLSSHLSFSWNSQKCGGN